MKNKDFENGIVRIEMKKSNRLIVGEITKISPGLIVISRYYQWKDAVEQDMIFRNHISKITVLKPNVEYMSKSENLQAIKHYFKEQKEEK